MDPTNNEFKFSLEFEHSFTRKLPKTATTAHHKFETKLDFSNLNDCSTREELLAFTNFDCKNASNIGKSVSITFSQAYNKNVILGSSSSIEPIIRKEETAKNQMHDLKLIFQCESQSMSNWMV
jgi:hypothetical protein